MKHMPRQSSPYVSVAEKDRAWNHRLIWTHRWITYATWSSRISCLMGKALACFLPSGRMSPLSGGSTPPWSVWVFVSNFMENTWKFAKLMRWDPFVYESLCQHVLSRTYRTYIWPCLETFSTTASLFLCSSLFLFWVLPLAFPTRAFPL